MCLLKKILGESRNLLAWNILELYGSLLALLYHYMYMYITLITVYMYMYITLNTVYMYMYITLITVYMYMTLLYSIL